MKRQVPEIFPHWKDLPILEFRGSGNRYFVLSDARGRRTVYHPDGKRGSVEMCKMELIQYMYDPTTGNLYPMVPITTEEELVERIERDEYGALRRTLGFKRWNKVDFRDLEPGELMAIEREIGNVVSAKRKWEAKRRLQFFRDENIYRAMEVMLHPMEEPTAPWNPYIVPTPKKQIVVAR